MKHAPDLGVVQGVLEGFDPVRRLVCQRGERAHKSNYEASREFFAEEAGRAAAVSYPHVLRSEWYERLLNLAGRQASPAAWSCLYRLAESLHVNVSALVTQFEHEGWIVTEGKGAGSKVSVQQTLFDMTGLPS